MAQSGLAITISKGDFTLVTSSRNGSHLTIVARPDRSSSWRANMMLLSALAVPSLGAAITFALAGAWPILPLAGLEMLALGAALYYVNLKMQYRHVITLDEEVVTIDKGFNVPREHWSLQRQAAGMTIVPENHPWESPELAVHDRNCSVSLGEFLGRDDQLRLIELLRGELRVRACSRRARQPF